jgi:hypothetical protein
MEDLKMKRTLFQLATSVLFLLFLIGCSSFPRSTSENDTMLIILTNFVRHTSPFFFGEYHAKVEKINDSSIVVDVSIDPLKQYQIVQGLSEGEYIIPEFYFLYYDNSKKSNVRPSGFRFAQQKGRITILQATFLYTQHGGGTEYYYTGEWTPLTNEKLLELYKAISQEENFKTWQLSEKTAELVEQIKKP